MQTSYNVYAVDKTYKSATGEKVLYVENSNLVKVRNFHKYLEME